MIFHLPIKGSLHGHTRESEGGEGAEGGLARLPYCWAPPAIFPRLSGAHELWELQQPLGISSVQGPAVQHVQAFPPLFRHQLFSTPTHRDLTLFLSISVITV